SRLDHLARIGGLDWRPNGKQLANGHELIAPLFERRHDQSQSLTGCRGIRAALQVHGPDRPGLDLGEHRPGYLRWVRIERIDGIDGPFDRNQPGRMNKIERATVIAAAGEAEVARRDPGDPDDRALRHLDLLGLGRSRDRSELVAAEMEGGMRVAVIADFEVWIAR